MVALERPLLEAKRISRSFGTVVALDNVDFEARPGEVTALIGDNGAGKSTLVKALSGNLQIDSGEIIFDGKPLDTSNPSVVSEVGIETVFQDLALAPHLDPVENMFLGREISRRGIGGILGLMNRKAMADQTRSAFEDLGATVQSLSSPVGEMSGGQRQAVAIARAVHWASRVIFLDEPTAALGVRQTKNVLDTIKKIRDKGLVVVFISHSMPHVMEVADRIQVLRLGRRVASADAANTSMEELVGYMTGALVGGSRS